MNKLGTSLTALAAMVGTFFVEPQLSIVHAKDQTIDVVKNEYPPIEYLEANIFSASHMYFIRTGIDCNPLQVDREQLMDAYELSVDFYRVSKSIKKQTGNLDSHITPQLLSQYPNIVRDFNNANERLRNHEEAYGVVMKYDLIIKDCQSLPSFIGNGILNLSPEFDKNILEYTKQWILGQRSKYEAIKI